MLKDFLWSICKNDAVSGREYVNFPVYDEYFGKYTDEKLDDNLGGRIYKKQGDNGKKIMLAAHGDEIGLMVNGIFEGGYLSFVAIGGVPAPCLVAQEVLVYGEHETIFGVIGLKPPHVMTQADRDKKLSISDLYIDTGYKKEDLEKIIKIGDTAVVKTEPVELLGKQVSAKAFDDKIGIAVMYEVAKKLERIPHKSEVNFAITAQEEVGIRGAGAVTYLVRPDIAIILDVCHGNSYNKKDELDLGKGLAVAIGGRLHPALTKKFIEICKENRYPYQIEASPASTSTDAENISIAGDGVPCILCSIPTRYMHTATEVIDLKDAEDLADCIAKFINELDYLSWEELLCF